jgi:hypothetical protein
MAGHQQGLVPIGRGSRVGSDDLQCRKLASNSSPAISASISHAEGVASGTARNGRQFLKTLRHTPCVRMAHNAAVRMSAMKPPHRLPLLRLPGRSSSPLFRSPYLVGPSAAHSVLDAVRAARAVPHASATSRFAVWGESQGGHATLWTARLAPEYAPELRPVGAATDAPPAPLNHHPPEAPSVTAFGWYPAVELIVS